MGINFVSVGIKTKFMGNSVSLSVVYIPFWKVSIGNILSESERIFSKFVGMFISQITYPDVQYDWLVRIHQSIYFSDFQYDQSNFLSRFLDDWLAQINRSTIWCV